MRFLLFSSQLLNIYNLANVFSNINHEFFITPLIPFDKTENYNLYLSRYKNINSQNVHFYPIFLRSPNQSFRNLINPLIVFSDFLLIFKVIQYIRPDVIIGMYLLHAYPLVFFKKIFRFKLFTIAVGGDIYGQQGVLYNLIRKIIYKNSELIFAVGYELKNMIQKEGGKNVTVIPTGVDPKFFKQLNSRLNLRQKWCLKQNEIIILTLSQLIKRKRVDDVIKAIYILKMDKCFLIKLIIVGEGPEKYFLEKLVSQLGLKDEVIFLGFVNEKEKLELLNLVDVYVLASLKEGLPFSLLEAMSCGCICISTPVGDISKVIVEDRNGFIINPKDPKNLAILIKNIISLPKKQILFIRNQARNTIINNYDFNKLIKYMIDIIVNHIKYFSM